jgi:PPOX class probable F420-dependent enzyme
MTVDAAAERFLREHTRTFLVTLRLDGSPACHPMVGLWRDGALWMNTYRKSAKARNIRHEPRVACVVMTDDAAGVPAGVVLRGRAEFVDAVVPRAADSARAPVGREVTDMVQSRLASGKRVVVRVVPDEVRRFGEHG